MAPAVEQMKAIISEHEQRFMHGFSLTVKDGDARDAGDASGSLESSSCHSLCQLETILF